MAKKSPHSICRWTFNAGKGGFVPGDMRPAWNSQNFTTVDMIELVAKTIRPRLPGHIELGIELHYDSEVDDRNAKAVAKALVNNGLYLAMVTPAHTATSRTAGSRRSTRESARLPKTWAGARWTSPMDR